MLGVGQEIRAPASRRRRLRARRVRDFPVTRAWGREFRKDFRGSHPAKELPSSIIASVSGSVSMATRAHSIKTGSVLPGKSSMRRISSKPGILSSILPMPRASSSCEPPRGHQFVELKKKRVVHAAHKIFRRDHRVADDEGGDAAFWIRGHAHCRPLRLENVRRWRRPPGSICFRNAETSKA